MSSKRRLRRIGCRGKVQFATKEEAVAVLHAMWRQGKRMSVGTVHLAPYPCQFGAHWHNGHSR